MDGNPLNSDIFKEKLLFRKDELTKLIESSIQSRKAVELDQSRVGRLSRMDAMQAQQMANETFRRREDELVRINSALLRIKNESFGFCLKCEEDISMKRLENDPSTTMCIECANSKNRR